MINLSNFRIRILLSASLIVPALTLVACNTSAVVTSAHNNSAGDTDIQRAVRPGQPGEASAVLGERDLVRDDIPPHTDADTHFMQGMIAHHAQALVMTDLVPDRTDRPDLLLLAERIDVSQGAEIKLMQQWLQQRGESVPMVPKVNTPEEIAAAAQSAGSNSSMSGMHAGHAGMDDMSGMDHSAMMPGMLSAADLEKLAAASGDEFYKLFLQYMIGHHEGALTMVADLFTATGAGQDTDIFLFASDVDIDQRIEIDRMHQMLDTVK